MTRFAAVLLVCTLVPGAVLAAPAPAPAQAPAVQTVIDCRKLDDSAARLACYDRAVDAMARAESSGDLVTIDRQQRGALRTQAFGFNLPALSLLGGDKSGGEDDRITATAESVSRDASGRWIVRLQGGAVWVQTDDAVLFPEPHAGSRVVIRKGALGSFFMDFDGRPGVRAARRS